MPAAGTGRAPLRVRREAEGVEGLPDLRWSSDSIFLRIACALSISAGAS